MKKMIYIIIGIVVIVLIGIFVFFSAKQIEFMDPETGNRSGGLYYVWQKEWWGNGSTEKNQGENQSTEIVENITYEELQKLLNTKVRLEGKAVEIKGLVALILNVTNKIAGNNLSQEIVVYLEETDLGLENFLGDELSVSGLLVYKKVNDYVSKFEIDDGILKERLDDGKDYVLENIILESISGIIEKKETENKIEVSITKEEAEKLAIQKINENSSHEMVISKIKENPDGWIFYYDSKEAVETGNVEKYGIPGNVPLFIKKDGTIKNIDMFDPIFND